MCSSDLEPNRYVPEWAQQKICDNEDRQNSDFWGEHFCYPGHSSWFDESVTGTNLLAKVPKEFFKDRLRRARQLSLQHERAAGPAGRRLSDAEAAAGDPTGGAATLLLEGEEEVAACNATFEVYDEATPCPGEGSIICGDATGVAPDGTSLARPFRRLLTECARGCACDESATAAVRYETCAASACSYLYTGAKCSTAFSIGSSGEAHAAEGMMLHYSPLLGGGGFNEPTVTLHAAVNPRYASGDGGDHLFFNGASGSEPGMQGVLVTHAAPMPLSLDDEASTMVSIPTAGGFATSFPFLGEHHTSLNIASNGYVTFGPPPTAVASEATSESQFSVDKGPSFSLLLADLKVPNVHVTHLERVGKSYAEIGRASCRERV